MAIIIIPIVVRTTEDMLSLIPNTLREAVIGLGAPKWKMIVMVCWKAATSGIITGILAFIPNIGAFVSGVLMVAVGFSAGVDAGLWAIGTYVIVQGLDGYVFSPLVAKKTVDMPPALTLGAQLGMVGFVLIMMHVTDGVVEARNPDTLAGLALVLLLLTGLSTAYNHLRGALLRAAAERFGLRLQAAALQAVAGAGGGRFAGATRRADRPLKRIHGKRELWRC